MTKTATICVRVEPELKRRAEDLFSQSGMSAAEAITLFYRQTTLQQGLPFAVLLPNTATVEALGQARSEAGLNEYAGLEELKAEFD